MDLIFLQSSLGGGHEILDKRVNVKVVKEETVREVEEMTESVKTGEMIT